MDAVSFFEMSPHEVRKLINSECFLTKADTPDVGVVEEQVIEAAGQPTPLRIYSPSGKGPFPLILFIHGGACIANGE